MVVIEDLDDIEDKGPGASSSGDPAAPTIKKGFLNDGKEIYGPEGSSQGNVTEEQKKAWEKEDQNRELNRRTGSGAYDSDFAKPQWFTSEWPSNCQYNNPGCAFDSLKTSEHESETHQEIIRKSDRWLGIIDNVEAKEVRLSFLGMRDSDLEALVEALRSRNSIENIDISFNHIKDAGVQALVGALAQKAFPCLKQLRIYKNEFTKLGTQMLQGLKYLRKDLEVLIEEPAYFRPTSEG